MSSSQIENPIVGIVVALQTCPGYRKPMIPHDVLSLQENLGIIGDKHAIADSYRQVLAMEKETLDALGLSIGLIKENITTLNIDLMALKHKQHVSFGKDVILEAVKACAPCSRMEEIRPGLLRELAGKRGMLFRVMRGGDVRLGDAIRILESDIQSGRGQ